MENFDEKRDFTRMNVVYEMQCKIKGSEESHKAWSVNLSGSGIFFLSEQRFRVDDTVKITIPPETDEDKIISFSVTIIRCQFKQHGFYEIAASFIRMRDNEFIDLSYRLNR